MTKLLLIFVLCAWVPNLWSMETATEPQKLTGTAVIAQNYDVGYEWRQDATGTVYGPYADLLFKQKLFRNFTSELSARIFKAASSDDVAGIYLETADMSYIGSWLTLTGGRRDLGPFLSPGSYFGAYSTMGERQLDAAGITFPFRLFADIPDADAQVNAPYNALSFLFVPNLFSAAKSSYDASQGIALVQMRVKFRTGQMSSDLYLNYAYGLDTYFVNSSIDNAGTVDLSYALGYGFGKTRLNYAIQNLKNSGGTSVLAAGQDLSIKALTFGFLETASVEAQLPLGGDPANPFTGGNPQDIDAGTLPQWCWFVRVTNKLGSGISTDPAGFYYGGALTNSVGDYTLARLAEGTISVPVGPGYGLGPKVQGLTLRSATYTTYSGIIYAGYQF